MKPANTLTEYPTVSMPLMVLFNVLIVSWWLEVGIRMSFFAAIRWEFLLAATASVCALVRRTSQPRALPGAKATGNSDVMRWMVLFVVVQIINLPLAVDFDVAWNAVLNRVIKYAILGWLVSEYVVSPLTLRLYLFSSLAAFLKVGQEGFLGKITGGMVWENQGIMRLHGPPGTMFSHPNSLSGKVVSAIPFLWYLYPTLRTRWARWLVLLQVIFSINIIVFAASRTGYLTFIVGVMFIIMLSNGNKSRLLLYACIAALVAVVAIPQEYQERFMSSFTGKEAEGHSSDARKGLFFDSVNVFLNHPLGIGAECFAVVQARAGRNPQPTHNLYTQVLAETGIQGLICFIGLVAVVLRKALRVRQRFTGLLGRLEAHRSRAPPTQLASLNEEIRASRMMLGTATALVVFLLMRLTLGVFGHDLFEIYWWFAAGLVMALHNLLGTAEQRCRELTGDDPLPVGGSRRGVQRLSRQYT